MPCSKNTSEKVIFYPIFILQSLHVSVFGNYSELYAHQFSLKLQLVSYTLEHIFLIIFVEEEHQIDKDNTDGQDITHENALYASLTIASVGLFFALLAIFRLLETWIRAGLKRNLHLSKYYLTILAVLLCAIPFVFSIAGDIVLILESSIYEEMTGQVRKALVLKLIGASCNVTLALLFLILLISYSLSAYTRISGSKRYAESQEKLPAAAGKSDEQKFRTVALLLLTMGTLVLVRVLYDLYIVAVVTKSGPFWDINANLVLVVSDGLILLLVAYILDLSMVKEATVAVSLANSFNS